MGLAHHTTTHHLRLRPLLVGLALSLLLGGCATQNRFETRTPAWADTLQGAADTAVRPPGPSNPYPTEPTTALAEAEQGPDFYSLGNDVLVRDVRSVADAQPQPGGSIKLNFQSANLLEVIKIILGDVLQRNYVVDPQVQGSVSMQTTNSLRREDLLPTLEMMLRMNNAALIEDEAMLRIVPLPDALAQARIEQLGDSALALPPGFSVRVVPLRYVSAEEMAQILAPFVADGNQLLRVDTARNLLVLASAGGQMNTLLETIDTFDVDSMTGMSVGLFTPDFVDAKTLAEELEDLLANPEYGLMRGLVRFVVVERLNGLMVVTPRAEHLARVRAWIQRLDRNTGDATPRLFIYRVQNGKAADLAEKLNELFSPGNRENESAELAPGLEAATVGAAPPADIASEEGNPEPPVPATPLGAGGGTSGVQIDPNSKVQIIADEANNALLILAKGTVYRQILTALRQLDISPMQVLIEVTIAEVQLTDNLKFGVEWFFNNRVGGGRTGSGTLDLGAAGLNAVVPGFSYLIQNSGGTTRAVLNTLATEGNVSVISSPSLLVLNNEEATINVGEEVPQATQSQSSTEGTSITNSIEYRDTGVLLTVKPRVNAGGLVIMEVEQEVSQAPAVVDDLTPRIRQRKISTSVAVNSGDTIILGGLIEEERDLNESGVPLLHKIPGLGALFGTKSDDQNRTELIVLITPRAIGNSTAALQVTEDYRRRLKRLIPDRTPPERAETAAAALPSASPSGPESPAIPVIREEVPTQSVAAPPSAEPIVTTEAAQPTAPAAPIEVEPVVTAQDAVPTDGVWGIQVGSFKNQQSAEQLTDRLRDAGVATESPKTVQVGDATYYRVHAGPTRDRDQALALMPRIRDIAGTEGMLVKHR